MRKSGSCSRVRPLPGTNRVKRGRHVGLAHPGWLGGGHGGAARRWRRRDAEVTIVGGGAVGCAVAYVMSRAGYADIQVIEQGELAGVTLGQAAGLVGQVCATRERCLPGDGLGGHVLPDRAGDRLHR